MDIFALILILFISHGVVAEVAYHCGWWRGWTQYKNITKRD